MLGSVEFSWTRPLECMNCSGSGRSGVSIYGIILTCTICYGGGRLTGETIRFFEDGKREVLKVWALVTGGGMRRRDSEGWQSERC